MYLCLGKSGQVSHYLNLYSEISCASSSDIDFNIPGKVSSYIKSIKPEAVINAAAMTNLNLCESNPDKAFILNAEILHEICEACNALSIPLVHISTDYVFDGKKDGPYTELDKPNPINIYGKSKYAGEKIVQQECKNFAILRTSLVFSSVGDNFLKKLLERMVVNKKIDVVYDQFGGPTNAKDIAFACKTIATKLSKNPDLSGIYHYSGFPSVSIHDFALELSSIFGLQATINQTSLREFSSTFERPKNCILDNSKIFEIFSISQPSWEPSLLYIKNIFNRSNLFPFIKNSRKKVLIGGTGWWSTGLQSILKNEDIDFIPINTSSKISLEKIKDLDAIYDASGSSALGIKLTDFALSKDIPFITTNNEFESVFGPLVQKNFNKRGVPYTNTPGDQPGTIFNLIKETKALGFDPIYLGSSKGYLNRYQTLANVKKWVPRNQRIDKILGFADGTKLNIEASVIANYTNFSFYQDGMVGINSNREDLPKNFRLAFGKKEHLIDFCFGIKEKTSLGGVFCISKLTNEFTEVTEDLDYLKLGNKPDYLFYKDSHLCYIESANHLKVFLKTFEEIFSKQNRNSRVVIFAKRDLKKGESLEHIGGDTFYGLAQEITDSNIANQHLEAGMVKNFILKNSIKKDDPILLSDIISNELSERLWSS
jgi:dTDP-4-dehydrorhamnose reductase